ncbi:MAG: dienelactone hydrolase family protein [Luteibaculum sp.]
MKSLLSLLVLSFIGVHSFAQSCCQMAAGQQFAMLSEDAQFVSSHTYNSAVPELKSGSNIKFKVPGQESANGYLIPANDADSKKFLFVFQEWWGLTPHIKAESEKFFEALGGDVHVLAIDMYDGKTATTAEMAGKLMQSRKEDRLRAIVDAAFAYAGEDAEVATLGWCFGGGWSLQAAIQGNDQVEACVMYYGMPETDPNRIEKIKAPVLGIFAEQDGWINHEIVDKFEDRMRALEKDVEFFWYDAVHAFANPSNNEYNAIHAGDAFKKSVDFLKENLL